MMGEITCPACPYGWQPMETAPKDGRPVLLKINPVDCGDRFIEMEAVSYVVGIFLLPENGGEGSWVSDLFDKMWITVDDSGAEEEQVFQKCIVPLSWMPISP